MTWRARWRLTRIRLRAACIRHRPADHSDEAAAALAQLEDRSAHVEGLGVQLRELQEANHFSAMVRIAMGQTRG